jgi:hypothetical protein
MTTALAGIDLLRAASGVAASSGEFVVARYLERAAVDHARHGACPCWPKPCAFEIEARRVLGSGQ